MIIFLKKIKNKFFIKKTCSHSLWKLEKINKEYYSKCSECGILKSIIQS